MIRNYGLIAGAIVALACGPALAEWPEKPVTITVAYGAGGTTDVMARMVGEALSKALGQPVIIENRPGAGGALATRALTKVAADGYNLVGTTSTSITLDPHLADLGYQLGDFTYVAAVGQFPEAFIALPSKNWKTINDALASAKAAGKMNYASTTTVDRMVAAIVGKKAGVNLVPVPTKGGAEAVAQVRGGHVDLAYSSGAWYPQGKSGDVTALAVLGGARLPEFPNVPTFKELGYDVSSVNLIAFVAPKGVPADVRRKLDAAFGKAAKDKAVVDLLNRRGLNNFVEIGDVLAATMKDHSETYKKMIQEAGLK
jgi:tripartite-type tricarboxylate transporter receptor subunit TctC